MNDVPPMSLEVTPEGLVVPVEAPACGERLDIPERGIHLICDRPAGHSSCGYESTVLSIKHRHILQMNPPQAVGWCGTQCAQPCEPLRAVLEDGRLSVLQVQKDEQ
jgi:hypothetical protein